MFTMILLNTGFYSVGLTQNDRDPSPINSKKSPQLAGYLMGGPGDAGRGGGGRYKGRLSLVRTSTALA